MIWTSSIEASPSFYDSEDWQLIKTAHSYESSKYQIDIISTHLDRRAIEETTQGSAVPVRHVVVQPGVASTNISNALIGSFLDILKVLTFYIVRFLVVLYPLIVLTLFAGPIFWIFAPSHPAFQICHRRGSFIAYFTIIYSLIHFNYKWKRWQ